LEKKRREFSKLRTARGFIVAVLSLLLMIEKVFFLNDLTKKVPFRFFFLHFLKNKSNFKLKK